MLQINFFMSINKLFTSNGWPTFNFLKIHWDLLFFSVQFI